MELNEIWNNFAERMAEIELFQYATKATSKNELDSLTEYSNVVKENPSLKDLPKSVHNMSFYDARTGIIKFYNYKKRSLEDYYLHVLLHKNKQYQWLLSEAYEEFEDYLENVYAYFGYKNNCFWPLKDYGNIFLTDICKKDYDWYVKQAKKKNEKEPHSILNRFRNHFPALKDIETKNKINVNLSLAITLIEKLRHIIVHKGGKVSSKDEFIRVTTEQIGLYNNGRIAQEHIDFINLFFGKSEYENLITLLEIRIHPEIPIDIHVCRFGQLIDYLMAYAAIVYDYVASSIENTKV